MKITDINVLVIEVPNSHASTHRLIQVPTVQRMQWTHRGQRVEGPTYLEIMRVRTDEGVEGYSTIDGPLTAGPVHNAVTSLRTNTLGEDPLRREFLFQKLQLGTRWIYQNPGWFGPFDNCLWDIAGKVAGLPVYQLLGQVRDGLPVYQTAGDGPVELYMEHIEFGKQYGIQAYKPHSYKGGQADIPLMTELRKQAGDDFALMLDPVCSYTPREAVEVARVLDDLGFVWLEEPFHEQKMNQYQELCASVNLPILATERLMFDMDLTAQWLIQGATNLLRGNARHGTTQVLKLAHFAELYGTTIELNGMGGLWGQIHAHLGAAIHNTSYYEQSMGRWDFDAVRDLGMLNPPEIRDGRIFPANGPGWGIEWNLKRVKELTIEEL